MEEQDRTTTTAPERPVEIAGGEVGLVASALQEYAEACLLGAELSAGRDEGRRAQNLADYDAARSLLRRFRTTGQC